jgi:hypothetical protein
MLDFPVVPVLLKTDKNFLKTKDEFKEMIFNFMSHPSALNDTRFWNTEKEGVVVRVKDEFVNDEFENSVYKNVRANHVQTDSHWQKNWKRAKLVWELEKLKKI